MTEIFITFVAVAILLVIDQRERTASLYDWRSRPPRLLASSEWFQAIAALAWVVAFMLAGVAAFVSVWRYVAA